MRYPGKLNFRGTIHRSTPLHPVEWQHYFWVRRHTTGIPANFPERDFGATSRGSGRVSGRIDG